MAQKGREDVLKAVVDQKVKFIRLWFTDVLGSLKSFAITAEELETALSEGMGFDGSSIEGYARIHESDMIAKPDPATFAILPWRPTEDAAVARMFCDVLQPDGSPYAGDPRYALKRNLQKAAELGFAMYVGPELEYFYFKGPDSLETLDAGGYFDLTPLDVASDLRRDTVLALEKLDIGVEYSHHEVAPSQHEIDLRFMDALAMADAAMTYRLTVKEVALMHGVYATFMPKPLFGENGSGMHTHQSLFKDGENAFFDANAQYHLSETGKCYIAGLLRHAREICAVVAQWVNSYKRLVPGYEAPVYVSWAQRNRSALVRVPMYKPRKAKATRAEFRCPEGLRAARAGGGGHLRDVRRREGGAGHCLPARQPGRSHCRDRGQRIGPRSTRGSHLRQVHRQQEDRMGQVPYTRQPLRAEGVPADPLSAARRGGKGSLFVVCCALIAQRRS
jgi:glutamine synthetase